MFIPIPSFQITHINTTMHVCTVFTFSIVVYLHVVGREIRGLTNSTCGQLRIPFTLVCVSLSGSSGVLVWTSKDARIPPALSLIFILKVSLYHLGYWFIIIIELYYFSSIPLAAFTSQITSTFEVQDLYFSYSNLKPLAWLILVCVCFIASHTCWPYQHMFLWAVKIWSFYMYLCTFYYSLFYLVWFYIINVCSGISQIDHLF